MSGGFIVGGTDAEQTGEWVFEDDATESVFLNGQTLNDPTKACLVKNIQTPGFQEVSCSALAFRFTVLCEIERDIRKYHITLVFMIVFKA